MTDFSFSFTENEDIANLLSNFGLDTDRSQSEPRTIPEITVSASNHDEQDQLQSRRSSWTSEDEVMSNVIELSLKTAAEEVHNRLWYKDYSTNKPSSSLPSISGKGGMSHPRGLSAAQSVDEYLLGGEQDLFKEPAPPYPQSTTGDDDRRCADCKVYGPNRSYCNVCSLSMCVSCWDRQLCHKTADHVIPHEKTPISLAQKTKAVFNPDIKDEAEREELHCKDVLTSWFGVHREDTARPLLRDYGRFEGLMASMKQSSENQFSRLDSSARYPSFVSFVGQTGAGKSSLIKLIVDLGAKTQEQFDTPVVGTIGNTSPTSTDVHLYMDPHTSDSDHPILYADCEGLEGGEREPVAAKAVKKRAANAMSSVPYHSLQPVSERDLIWADKSWRRTREFAVRELYPRLLYTFSDVIVFVLKNPKQVLILQSIILLY
jgi:energy-coupling factor transporter ATP-binding protein EcfA2